MGLGRHIGVKPCIIPVRTIREAGSPRAAPCLSFAGTVSPALPRRSAVEAGRLAGLGDPRL